MEQVLIFATVLAPVITALVELVKRSVPIPKRVIPATSLLTGMFIGAAAYPFTDLDLVLRLWAGGLSGLAATGLFELAINKRTDTVK